MVTAAIDLSKFETCPINKVAFKTKQAMAERKWLFVWDKNGAVSTFFKYQGNLCDFGHELMAAAQGRKSVDDALKVMRDSIVFVQRNAGLLMVDLGKTTPAFNDRSFLKQDIFTAEQAFYRGELPRCLPLEDNPCAEYTLEDDYGIAMRSTVETEEELMNVLARIPHS